MRLAALWCGASALVVRQQPTRRRLRIAPRMAVSEIAMPALSSKYNDNPQTASRPYDANRDGFVIAGGGETGYHLASTLEGQRFTVVLLEKDRARCEFLASNLKFIIFKSITSH